MPRRSELVCGNVALRPSPWAAEVTIRPSENLLDDGVIAFVESADTFVQWFSSHACGDIRHRFHAPYEHPHKVRTLPSRAFIAQVAGKSECVAVAYDPVVPMLLGIAIFIITLVVACVVSIVLRPDPEVLRPIEKQASRSPGDL